MSTQNKKVVSVRIDPKLAAQVKAYAAANDMKVAQVYELALKRLVREGGQPVTRNDLNLMYNKLLENLPNRMALPPLVVEPVEEVRKLTWRERLLGKTVK